jgi:hypothetical protein
MLLKHLTIILILFARVRRVVTWRRRRPTRHRCLALVNTTPLGGPDLISLVLGPLLTTRVHPETR